MATVPSIEKPTVIVVEDEPITRMFACVTLSDAGFKVMSADHADTALAMLEAHAAVLRALFTDVHVPGSMDGLALAHLAHRRWPWIALLVASGRARPAPHELPEGGRFLSKPYEPEHVVRHLRELVHA